MGFEPFAKLGILIFGSFVAIFNYQAIIMRYYFTILYWSYVRIWVGFGKGELITFNVKFCWKRLLKVGNLDRVYIFSHKT